VRKYVFRLFLDFEKEEAWYNKMAQKGWMLDGYYFIVYRFVKGEPGEYVYREELLPHLAGSSENLSYLDFLKSAEVEIVAMWGKWIIYRRKASDGIFEIYTDTDSRIAHYRRVSRLTLLCCAIVLAAMLFLLGITLAQGSLVSLSWPRLFILSAIALTGLTLFFLGWRYRRKYRSLVRAQQLLEWE